MCLLILWSILSQICVKVQFIFSEFIEVTQFFAYIVFSLREYLVFPSVFNILLNLLGLNYYTFPSMLLIAIGS